MEEFDWRVWVAIGAALAVVGGVWYSVWMKREPNHDEIEQKRRAHINQVGRIAEGQILEIIEGPAAPAEMLTILYRSLRQII